MWVTEQERDAATAAQGEGRIHSVREQNEETRLERSRYGAYCAADAMRPPIK